MPGEIKVEKVEVGGKLCITITTEIQSDADRGDVSLSAWPVRVGAPGGLNWKSFKAARQLSKSAEALRAQTK